MTTIQLFIGGSRHHRSRSVRNNWTRIECEQSIYKNLYNLKEIWIVVWIIFSAILKTFIIIYNHIQEYQDMKVIWKQYILTGKLRIPKNLQNRLVNHQPILQIPGSVLLYDFKTFFEKIFKFTIKSSWKLSNYWLFQGSLVGIILYNPTAFS